MVYGTLYAGVDYNLTLRPLQSRLQHIYHRQPNARVHLNLCHSRLYPLSGTLDLASAHLQTTASKVESQLGLVRSREADAK